MSVRRPASHTRTIEFVVFPPGSLNESSASLWGPMTFLNFLWVIKMITHEMIPEANVVEMTIVKAVSGRK